MPWKVQEIFFPFASIGFQAEKNFFCGNYPEHNLLFPCFKYRKKIRSGLEIFFTIIGYHQIIQIKSETIKDIHAKTDILKENLRLESVLRVQKAQTAFLNLLRAEADFVQAAV